MELTKLCAQYFDCCNLYDVLGVDKTTDKKARKKIISLLNYHKCLVCTPKAYVNMVFSVAVKRAYFKRSLAFHPNSTSEKSKTDEGFEKFKTLFKVYSILNDKERKWVYDKTGKNFNNFCF